MTSNPIRRDALLDLVQMRCPVREALARLSAFALASQVDLVTLRVRDLVRALDEFGAGTVDADDLSAWAEAVHGREDIALDSTDRSLLADALFELSTPELFGAMNEIVDSLRHRLR